MRRGATWRPRGLGGLLPPPPSSPSQGTSSVSSSGSVHPNHETRDAVVFEFSHVEQFDRRGS